MLIVLSLRTKSEKIQKYPHDGPMHFMHLVFTKKLLLPETNILPYWVRILSFRVSGLFSEPFLLLVLGRVRFQKVARLRWQHHLVGGFNPLEKYESKWESSPNRGENIKKHLKPPPSHYVIAKKNTHEKNT